MARRRIVIALSVLSSALGLAGCLWGAATIGGTLSGLPAGNSVTLQNSGTDNLVLTQNGAFEFAGTVDEGESYSVTVLTQPAAANCTVANGSGTIATNGRDVTNVTVTCTSTASVTGTLSGLPAGTSVTLTNGSTTLPLAANGAFAFPGVLAVGTAYNVAIAVNGQPVGATCTVTNGSGTIVASTPTNITVTCS
jgi:hypothetical protein